MPLNPQVEALLSAFAAFPVPDYATVSVEEMRFARDQPMMQGPPPEVAKVRGISIPLAGRTLAARLYIPQNCADPSGLTLYFHGGGWVFGTLDTHDATCRALARESGHALLSVAYRLAPEHRYPAAIEDCYEALVWAHSAARSLGIDPHRIALAGDSAGASLAAAAAILARDRNGPALRHQLLLYPVADCDFETASYRENGGGEYFLGTEGMRWFWDQYLGDLSPADAPLAAILRVEDLSGLPPATIFTAEYDPLRDEGMHYARRLKEAGVQVDASIAEGMIHGFASMFEAVPDACAWLAKAGAALRRSLA